MNLPEDLYRCFYSPDPGAPPTEHCGAEHVDRSAAEHHCAALNQQINELRQHGRWAPVQGDILLALWEDDSDGETSLSVGHLDKGTEPTVERTETQETPVGDPPSSPAQAPFDHYEQEFSLVGERLERTLRGVKEWITARWNTRRVLAVTGIGALLLFSYLGFRAVTQDDEPAVTPAETGLDREEAADVFWSNLTLAADDMLESFTVVCSERPDCREEMQSLTAWACYFQHRSAFASSTESALARMMKVTLREPVEMLRKGEITADRAWQLLPAESSAHMSENIVKAASPTVCVQAETW